MHNPAAILENDTHKLQWDFIIHMDPQILAKRLDLIIINEKRIRKIVDFIIKLKECENKYRAFARELKKTIELAGDN